jgi:hypothetical protein
MSIAQRVQVLGHNINTIYHLEKLANHPNTPPGEAAAARNRAAHLRKLLNVLEDVIKKPSPNQSTSSWRYVKIMKNGRPKGASIIKTPDGKWTTYHTERPTKKHSSFEAADAYLKKYGYKL